MYNNYRPRIQVARREHMSGMGALDTFIYELKPLTYSAIALYALNADQNTDYMLKVACFGVLVFVAYIVYARLVNRGYLQ